MRILFLCSAFNGLTQRACLELQALEHEVSTELALSETMMTEAVDLHRPELIICPFLKERVPETIWKNHTCIIIHPGIAGDRGPSSLDWALMENFPEWGVTALQAEEEFDAGRIWATQTFPMRQTTKANLYRNEVTNAAVQVMLKTVERFERNHTPPPAGPSTGRSRPLMKQADRRIDWSTDSTEQVLRKIRAADGFPGVLDTIEGIDCYLYGGHQESELRGESPGAILAHRGGAICRATTDGAVWITHLRRRKKGDRRYFKLPATAVLGPALEKTAESPHPGPLEPRRTTLQEIWYEEHGTIGILHFNFYNGAMGVRQCNRLREAVEAAAQRDTSALVLMCGTDFWSNGIDLNAIEAAEKPSEEAWQAIQAINNLIFSIMKVKQLTISGMQANAGAGGVFLGLATDLTYAKSGTVLNPHYQTMRLHGSEYWTHSLPLRVGAECAQQLTHDCLPVSASVADSIGLINGVVQPPFAPNLIERVERIIDSPDYEQIVDTKASLMQSEDYLEHLQLCRDYELTQMRCNFNDPSFHIARRNFVHKVPPQCTPTRLALHRDQDVANWTAM